jgi:hypothetical protein
VPKGVAISWDGLVVAIAADGGSSASSSNGVWVSRSVGATFTQHLAGKRIASVACSVDCSIMAAAEWDGPIWTSVDDGATWVAAWDPGVSLLNVAPAMSADGGTLLGMFQVDPSSGPLPFVSYAPGASDPVVVKGTTGASIRLVYLGGDRFAVIEATGSLQAQRFSPPG